MRNAFNKLFGKNKKRIKKHSSNLTTLLKIRGQMHSATGGIHSVSASLYNFINNDYVPFSLIKFSDAYGVYIDVAAPSSSELIDFSDIICHYSQYEYGHVVKDMKSYFEREIRLFGDWYDGDETINTFVQEYLLNLLTMFLRTRMLETENDNLLDADYQKVIEWVEKNTKRYPGLVAFSESTDYRVLLSDALNLLIALERITLRSLGESSEI